MESQTAVDTVPIIQQTHGDLLFPIAPMCVSDNSSNTHFAFSQQCLHITCLCAMCFASVNYWGCGLLVFVSMDCDSGVGQRRKSKKKKNDQELSNDEQGRSDQICYNKVSVLPVMLINHTEDSIWLCVHVCVCVCRCEGSGNMCGEI